MTSLVKKVSASILHSKVAILPFLYSLEESHRVLWKLLNQSKMNRFCPYLMKGSKDYTGCEKKACLQGGKINQLMRYGQNCDGISTSWGSEELPVFWRLYSTLLLCQKISLFAYASLGWISICPTKNRLQYYIPHWIAMRIK